MKIRKHMRIIALVLSTLFVLGAFPSVGFASSTPSLWAVEGMEQAKERGLYEDYIGEDYQANISRQWFCCIIYLFIDNFFDGAFGDFKTAVGSTKRGFRDTDYWVAEDLASIGIINGYPDGNFLPDGALSRAEAATIINNLLLKINMRPARFPDAGFADIGDVDWAKYAINIVAYLNVMNGTGGDTFSPHDYYSREQAVLTLNNLWSSLEDIRFGVRNRDITEFQNRGVKMLGIEKYVYAEGTYCLYADREVHYKWDVVGATGYFTSWAQYSKEYIYDFLNINHNYYLSINDYAGFATKIKFDAKAMGFSDVSISAINEGAERIKNRAAGIRDSIVNEGGNDYDVIVSIVKFVQELDYYPELDEYPKFPTETLMDYGGDCEDTAILLAAMLDSIGYDCILLDLPKHMAVGIRDYHHPEYGAYLDYDDIRYYVLETTGRNWEIGQLPPSWTNENGDTTCRVLPLK